MRELHCLQGQKTKNKRDKHPYKDTFAAPVHTLLITLGLDGAAAAL